jgi:mRNA interferase MazF
MRTFERGDIVRAPFPYTDRDTTQHRPALVVSGHGLGPTGSIYWIVMITGAANRGWPHDVPIGDDHQKIGLPIPSVIRPAKIAAVDAVRIEAVARLPSDLLARVDTELAAIGLASA